MAGKPYSIKEMKDIVNFLIENKAYGEIKGRKKWMELANSKLTTRTWQSLKETFLKRILPDIHNPYYKLTTTQVRSFREGRHIQSSQTQSKLEIRTTSDDSSSNDKPGNTKANTPNKENKNEENPPGETIQCANVRSQSRASVETLVLDSEDGDLDRERLDDEKAAVEEISGKSIRDCITYSEPLTPMMQQLIDDFTTSEDEGRLQIDEGSPANIDSDKEEEINNQSPKKNQPVNGEKESNFKIPQANDLKKEKTILEKKSLSLKKIDLTQKKTCDSDLVYKTKESQSQPNTNTSTDTTIPNNQESLAYKKAGLRKSDEKDEENNNVANKPSRKRTISQFSDGPKKKKQMSNEIKEATKSKKALTSTQDSASTENPCLKSISLYAEQFTPTNYLNSGSSSSEEETSNTVKTNAQEIMPKINKHFIQDTVVLKSNSESETEVQQVPHKQQNKKLVTASKDRKLASVFGFSSGAVVKKARQQTSKSYNLAQPRHVFESTELSSSESSDSDCPSISPPRYIKSKYRKKYLTPKSARIVSLQDDGELFVVNEKEVIPLVKDGQKVKNIVDFLARDEQEDMDDSYWRDKFIEERRKCFELAKLLESVKQPNQIVPQIEKLPDVTNPNPISRIPMIENIPKTSGEKSTSNQNAETNSSLEQPNKTVKIKFTKNDQEVQLEGHWSQLEPAIQKVVGILQAAEKLPVEDNNTISKKKSPAEDNNTISKKKTPVEDKNTISKNKSPVKDKNTISKKPQSCETDMKPSGSLNPPSIVDITSSRSITPVLDVATQHKVNLLERTIFKKIEDIDRAEKSLENINLAARGGALITTISDTSSNASKTSTENERTSAKEITVQANVGLHNGEEKDLKEKNESNVEVDKDNEEPYKKRNSKKNITPKKSKGSITRKSSRVGNTSKEQSFNDDDDSEILYRFPSPPPSNRKRDKSVKKNKINKI